METDKIAKALNKLERRLHVAEKGNRAVAIIKIWIEMFDNRFETPGELIKRIERLCKEVLTEK